MVEKKNRFYRRLILCECLAIAVMLFFVIKDFSNNTGVAREKAFDVDKFVSTIDESVNEVEIVDKGKAVNVSSLYESYSKALVFRLEQGIYEYPEGIRPAKVIIDPYDSIILCYADEDRFSNDLKLLESNETVSFVEEISVSDVICDTITTYDYSGTLSYAPDLLNSRYKVDRINSSAVIKVGIVDTGFYSKNSEVAQYVNLSDSFDYVNNDPNVCDGIDEHATVVASSMLDIVGENVARNNVEIIIGKCLENGVGSTYSVYSAICGLTDKGVDIINMSLGTNGSDALLDYAVNYAKSKGVILVAAAGNDAGVVSYPAAYDDSVIAVSACDRNKNIAYFSNTGIQVDFVAPGVDIVTDGVEYSKAISNGTSLACPIITGEIIIGMLDGGAVTSMETAISYLKNICEDLGSVGKDDIYGWGLPVFDIEEDETTTKEPTERPTEAPTEEPTEESTERPTEAPTEEPTEESTERPTEVPTEEPTEKLTEEPTEAPTERPTEAPIENPTESPKESPTNGDYSEHIGKVTGIWNPGISWLPVMYARYEWDTLTTASYYEVWRCDYSDPYCQNFDNLNWEYIGKAYTAEIEFMDFDIEREKCYLVKVRAIDANGNYGDWSEVIKVQTYSSSLSNLKWSLDGGTFTATFDEHPNAVGYELQIRDKITGDVWYIYSDTTKLQTVLNPGEYNIGIFTRSKNITEKGVINLHGGTDWVDIVVE